MKDYSTLILIYIIIINAIPTILGIAIVYGEGGIPAYKEVFNASLTLGSISLIVYYSTPMYKHKFLVFMLLILNCSINALLSTVFRRLLIVLMITFFVMGAIFNYHPLMEIVYHFLDKL